MDTKRQRLPGLFADQIDVPAAILNILGCQGRALLCTGDTDIAQYAASVRRFLLLRKAPVTGMIRLWPATGYSSVLPLHGEACVIRRTADADHGIAPGFGCLVFPA